ncbi:transglycosylase SLT domain-containing protein [Iodidimonas muriae]|nr:transglycosylase SLT domain-containing protein [Iodidimonas muriae]
MQAAFILAGLAGAVAVLSSKAGAAPNGRLSPEEVEILAEQTVKFHFPAVDPLMIRAMVEIESSRQPSALRVEPHISDASAGLMQTLVSTAQWLHDDMGARAFGRPTLERLMDAGTSMYFGTAYINWLRRYKGQPRSEQWIVESYNGGPGNSNSQTKNHYQKYLKAKQSLTGAF